MAKPAFAICKSITTLIFFSIKREFGHRCCVVTFDAFYKGLTDEEHNNAQNYNFDSPNALDFNLAFEKINGLLRYEDIHIPIYDFATHKRIPN